MAQKKISDFGALAALDNGDLILVARSTETYKATIALLKSAIQGGMVAADQGAAAAGKVLIVGPDGNVTVGVIDTGITIDATLTRSGDAADAKMAGDLIRALRADVNDLIAHGGGGTLIEKTITVNGRYDPADDNADGYSMLLVNVPTGGQRCPRADQTVYFSVGTVVDSLTWVGRAVRVYQ